MNVTTRPVQLSWNNYHKSVERIAAKFNAKHGNYRIHDHAFVEVAVIVRGTCLHHSVTGDSRPSPGQVFLFRPGAWHGYAEANSLALYNCCFDTALLGRELAWMADDQMFSKLLWSLPLSPKQHGMVSLQLSKDELREACSLLDQLQSLSSKDYLLHYGDHLGLLVLFLGVLARNAARTYSSSNRSTHRAVAAALKLIDEDLTNSWTLTSLASRAHVEPTYFIRLFREAIGLPPMAYLNRRRLELATNLLRRSDVSVAEVALQAGWPDANYFSRYFNRNFGMTPTRYRARFHDGRRVKAT